MKFNKYVIMLLLFFFSSLSFALSEGGPSDWEFKTVTGNLKPTPGCKAKEVATKQASTGYRYKKYTSLLCKNIAYGWTIAKVEKDGEVVCEPCEGGEYEGAEKYRCYVKDITVKCKIVSRGY